MAVYQKIIYCADEEVWLDRFKQQSAHFKCCTEVKIEKGLGYVGSAKKLNCRFEGAQKDLDNFLNYLGIAPNLEKDEENDY